MQPLVTTPSSVEITTDTLKKILNHSTNEIFVLDGEKRIIYVNSVCERHYGLKPTDIVGKYNVELFEKGYWKPSIVPIVFEKKKPVSIKQTTYIGAELMTTAIPILNADNDIELVVITSQELQPYKMMKVRKEKDSLSHESDSLEPNLITNCEKMKNLITFCQKVAVFDSTILIQGESGTGKGVMANYIHQVSKRKNGPFLTINCAAIPEELLESELFGYSQGAFTGANKTGKIGLVEAANEGTLFLDEIGEVSLTLQAKLLQVIQDKQFIPVGGREVKKANVRIIAATNRDLPKMVQNHQFREDLFYRLNVIDIHIPPLRERKEDIIPLTYNFLYTFNQKYDVDKLISQECLDLFTNYSWPGNVRQLENVIERLIVTSDSIITIDDVPDLISQNAKVPLQPTLPDTLDAALDEVKRTLVRKSFKKHGSSRKVAKDLNISQTRATKLIREYCTDLAKVHDE